MGRDDLLHAYAGRMVNERIGTTASYYLFDRLGSVVALVDTSAAVKDTYSYDPYGQVELPRFGGSSEDCVKLVWR